MATYWQLEESVDQWQLEESTDLWTLEEDDPGAEVFLEGLHRIETGLKAQTAAGLGGLLVE